MQGLNGKCMKLGVDGAGWGERTLLKASPQLSSLQPLGLWADFFPGFCSF